MSSNTGPVYLRFGADIADVTLMNPMFCEGLGCRVGIEICEALTQSTERLNAIEAQYRLFMTEARLTNGIEIGTEESPLDDWIACRI